MNVVLKLSKLCNLRCTYCYEYDHLADTARMPIESLGFFLRSLGDHFVDRHWRGGISFALHGGEPLLLPPEYLRAVVDLQRQHLGARGIPYSNAVQTNLYRVRDGTLELLEDLGISLGVSVDVVGGQRLTGAGHDAQPRVLENLQHVLASGARIKVGLITVLHALNVRDATAVYRYARALGLDYRILPVFSTLDPPERMRPLMLRPDQIVEALQAVALEYFRDTERSIKVYPITEYLTAAVRILGGLPGGQYDPADREWALIVDTNGDVYNHSEAYVPEHRMGNVFSEALGTVLDSPGRRATLDLREKRGQTCRKCPHAKGCSHIPVIEALPSERVYDASGEQACPVARPMIEFMMDLISRDAGALAAARGHAERRPATA